MKKNKKVALYSPYLNILGGGERHILSILKVFDGLGYEIVLLWDDPSIVSKIDNTLSLSFKHISVTDNFLKHNNPIIALQKTHEFDYFFYVTDGSYFLSAAKNNYIFAMVPHHTLYNMNLVNKIKTMNQKFICNSAYTKKWLHKWGVDANVIYPFINDDYFIGKGNVVDKEQIILSVGRFFGHLHSKKHIDIIKMFKEYKQSRSPINLTLYIVGGLDKKDQDYFNEVKKATQGDRNITVIANMSEIDLKLLYKKAVYYWHCTGYGIDESMYPEKMEHLGITPLEAMASGCVVFCYGKGGPAEIIDNGKTGYLFFNEHDLLDQMDLMTNNETDRVAIAENAIDYIKTQFTFKKFKQNVINYFELKK